MILGVPVNPVSPRAARAMLAAADVPTRVIDIPSLATRIESDGTVTVTDVDGVVAVDAIAPFLLFGAPAAVPALRALQRKAFCQNSIDAVLTADDKAATAVALAAAGLPQAETVACADDPEQVLRQATALGYPVVVKRTHGAQGRWVELAADGARLLDVLAVFRPEGPGALVLQRPVTEAFGTSVRAVVTGGRLVAASRRTAAEGEWRSNVASGAAQVAVRLDHSDTVLVESAARAVGLGHCGVDLLASDRGTLVLEVNSCPDFTSMLGLFPALADQVVEACLPA